MTRPPSDPFVRTVDKKARAYERAKQRPHGLWRSVALVGALGWTFILPVVVAAFIARWASRVSERPLIGLGILSLGVFVGVYASIRQVKRSLDDDEEDEGDAP
jgi:hypothetical protein